MSIRTVFCIECGEKRRARLKDDDVVPFQKECPSCGNEEFRDAVNNAE